MKIFIFVLPIHAKETRGSVAHFPSHYTGAYVGGIATGGASLSACGHNRSAPDGYGPAGRGEATARAWPGPRRRKLPYLSASAWRCAISRPGGSRGAQRVTPGNSYRKAHPE